MTMNLTGASYLLFVILFFAGCGLQDSSEKTYSEDNLPIYGTLKDVDGNTYTTVKIGTQIWMVDNLKTTHLNDGTPIPEITDSAAWIASNTPAHCFYNNNNANKNTYGALYNGFAITSGKLAPVGWHIPTMDEWAVLTKFIGGMDMDNEIRYAGGFLKEAGTAHWDSPNTGAIDKVGFKALPGGMRNDGSFKDIRKVGYWWTSITGTGSLYFNRMEYDNSGMWPPAWFYLSDGVSVRCVKD